MGKVRVFTSIVAALALLGGLGTVTGADDTGAAVKPNAQPPPPRVVPPPSPKELTKGKEIEPGVTIIHSEGAEFREYSAGGRVYAVEVIPKRGPPYWLYDIDNNGTLEMRGDFLNEMPPAAQWQILTW